MNFIFTFFIFLSLMLFFLFISGTILILFLNEKQPANIAHIFGRDFHNNLVQIQVSETAYRYIHYDEAMPTYFTDNNKRIQVGREIKKTHGFIKIYCNNFRRSDLFLLEGTKYYFKICNAENMYGSDVSFNWYKIDETGITPIRFDKLFDNIGNNEIIPSSAKNILIYNLDLFQKSSS